MPSRSLNTPIRQGMIGYRRQLVCLPPKSGGVLLHQPRRMLRRPLARLSQLRRPGGQGEGVAQGWSSPAALAPTSPRRRRDASVHCCGKAASLRGRAPGQSCMRAGLLPRRADAASHAPASSKARAAHGIEPLVRLCRAEPAPCPPFAPCSSMLRWGTASEPNQIPAQLANTPPVSRLRAHLRGAIKSIRRSNPCPHLRQVQGRRGRRAGRGRPRQSKVICARRRAGRRRNSRQPIPGACTERPGCGEAGRGVGRGRGCVAPAGNSEPVLKGGLPPSAAPEQAARARGRLKRGLLRRPQRQRRRRRRRWQRGGWALRRSHSQPQPPATRPTCRPTPCRGSASTRRAGSRSGAPPARR